MTINPGDLLEIAIWLDGRETPEQLERFETDVRAQLAHMADEEHAIIGPLMLRRLKPGDDRVPEVPNHIQGPGVVLLVAAAKVTGLMGRERFADDLELDDLRRLMDITRRAYSRFMPGQPRLTDSQCCTIINDLGPEAAADALRDDAVKLDRVLH